MNNVRTTNHRVGQSKFLIFPDYWKESWGQAPMLGIVWANDEFDAKYAAYDKGLLPYNFTFGPKPVLAKGRGQRLRKQAVAA